MRTTVALITLLALSLGGCSVFEGKKIDYKSAGSLPPLEAPPDLILPAADNRYALPGQVPGAQASYSAYSQDKAARSGAPSGPQSGALLAAVDKVHIERAGTQRWLAVELPPAEVWPAVKEFWQQMGFIVNLEVPEAGVMETDWAENRAKLPQDAIRGFLGRVLDSVYSTAERDKFRTRLEPVADGKGTEIYISHRGMYEVFEGTQGGGDQGQGRTVWQPRPADPELEAEMLRRMMTRFGVEQERAKTLLDQPSAGQQASLAKAADGAPGLELNEPFDRAWRRVGLALDRIGFAVVDRDRAKGTYFVRYADADALTSKEKDGFLSRLAFWRSDDAPAKAEKYRVSVSDKGESSQLAVYREDGAPATGETGERIVKLLHEQLK